MGKEKAVLVQISSVYFYFILDIKKYNNSFLDIFLKGKKTTDEVLSSYKQNIKLHKSNRGICCPLNNYLPKIRKSLGYYISNSGNFILVK